MTRQPTSFAAERRLASFVFVGMIAFCLIYSGRTTQGNELLKPARPNIVLIMADDMGWSDAGCYGGEVSTPAIDSLASAGLRFGQFYNNAICGPTRASLLTGLYCQQTGHAGHKWNEPKDFNRCATIGELLQRAGYHTMMVGKWQGRDLAVKRGFDRFFGPNCQAKISYYHEVISNSYSLNERPWKVPQQGFFMTDALSDYAVQFLKEAAGQKKPFFLYAAYIAPHWPLHTRSRDIAPYRENYLNTGWQQARKNRFSRQRKMGLIPQSWALSPAPNDVGAWQADPYKTWQAERMAAYAGQITCMDRGIGRILQAVREAGLQENTLVMFLSDNGAARNGGLRPSKSGFSFPSPKKWRLDGVPIKGGSGPNLMPGPHDTFAGYGHAWANVSNTPLNQFKATAFEGGIRTPLVVRWPRVIHQGNKITQQIGHVIDLMATCLDVAGASYPAELDGRKLSPLEGKSLLPVFQGKQREGHELLCWNIGATRAIRMGRWKLVGTAKVKSWKLYDMELDGGETNDLAKKDPQRVEQMAEQYRAWQQRVDQK